MKNPNVNSPQGRSSRPIPPRPASSDRNMDKAPLGQREERRPFEHKNDRKLFEHQNSQKSDYKKPYEGGDRRPRPSSDRPAPKVAPKPVQRVAPPEGQYEFFVACPRGLDDVLVYELKELGAIITQRNRLGVNIFADLKTAYRIVYCSRIASRVLRPVFEFDCDHDDVLYAQAKAFDWSKWMTVNQTFKINAHVRSSVMTHSQFASQRLKDAMCDYFREQCGERPNVDKESPDLMLDLQITQNRAQISISYSVGVLHKRGYREMAVDAPIKENLAAGILDLCEWGDDAQNTVPLYDAFCGSGTFLIEAALKYTRTPAGFLRAKQGFEGLPDFDEAAWNEIKAEAAAQMIPLPKGLIQGSDVSDKALSACKVNIEKAGFAGLIDLQLASFQKVELPAGCWLISNPPYGVRLEQDVERLLQLYKVLGQWLCKYKPQKAVLLLAFAEVKKALNLWSERRWLLDNGDLDMSVEEFDRFVLNPNAK